MLKCFFIRYFYFGTYNIYEKKAFLMKYEIKKTHCYVVLIYGSSSLCSMTISKYINNLYF